MMNATEIEESLFKYNKDVVWSLPVLCRYEPIWGAIYSCLKKLDVEMPAINAYGSPTNTWTGGRIPRWIGELDRTTIMTTFNYLKNSNATPTLTFTCTNLTEEDLKDRYTNYLLDLALDAGAHFIIHSEMLKNHIKEKDSNAYVVSSVIKATTTFQGPDKIKDYSPEKETEFYNNLLKEYDMVVVRPEYVKNTLIHNPNIINDLSRIEILINQSCLMNCPKSPAHYAFMEQFRNLQNDIELPRFQCVKGDYDLKSIYGNLTSIDETMVKKLVDAGVKHLKLHGRGDNFSNHGLALILFSQMFKTAGAAYVLLEELVRKAVDAEVEYFVQLVQSAASQNARINY